jgi:hypothetical protein
LTQNHKKGNHLNTLRCTATLVLAASFVACVGCGNVKGSQNVTTPQPSEKKGTSVIHFAIPIHKPGSQFLTSPQASKPGVRAASTRPRSEFIDSSANGNIVLFLDGQQVLSANFTPQWNGSNPVLGPGPSAPATSTPDGGSISYTSNVTATEIDVSVSLTTVADVAHTLGIVQLNGACVPDQYGRQLCLGDSGNTNGQAGISNGYVLSEGQTSFTLNTGDDNAGLNLTLNGVLEAGFLCDDACDGHAGTPDENGVYHLTAYPTDENGNAATGKAYSNGWWDIEEMDNQNLVTITTANPQPFNAPNIDAAGWDAQPFTFTCNGTGNTTIAARLLPTDPAKGPVTGFNYNSTNYPSPGAALGPVGADLYFGNVLSVQCTTYGSAIITVN